MSPLQLFMEDIILPIFGMGLGAFFLFGVYKTVNRWLDRRHERTLAEAGGIADPALREAVRQLEDRVVMLEDGTMRIQELEERLDFTERVLTQQRHDALPADGAGNSA